MMPCSYSERLIVLLGDRELEGPLRREVALHAASCIACTRALTSTDRAEELLRQALDEEIETVDFSNFWNEVASRLDEPRPAWKVRIRLWRERWWPQWSFGAPIWTAAAAVLLIALFLVQSKSSQETKGRRPPAETAEPLPFASGDQARIESLSAATTIFLWNEPTSNATVIWVGDDSGGLP